MTSYLLRDGTASAANILKLLTAFLHGEESAEGANAIFYFAGHGYVTNAESPGGVFLIPADGGGLPSGSELVAIRDDPTGFVPIRQNWISVQNILKLFRNDEQLDPCHGNR